MNDESILVSVKKYLGIDPREHAFDTQLMITINSILMVLNQVSVGVIGFTVTSETDFWRDFLEDDEEKFGLVRTYVCLRTKYIFDPPQSSIAAEALKATIAEFEWRLSITE